MSRGYGSEPEWLRILRQREREQMPRRKRRGGGPGDGGTVTPPGSAGPARPGQPTSPPYDPNAPADQPVADGQAEPAGLEPAGPTAGGHVAGPTAEATAVPIPDDLRVPAAGGPGHTAEERRRVRTRRVLLAAAGLLFALAVILGLEILGLSPISYSEWAFAFLATVVIQLIVWWIPYSGLDERIPWDRQYIYVPMLAGAALLSLYMYLAVEPVARLLVLMTWFVALLFTAGLAGFLEVTILSGAMAIGYLLGARALAGEGLISSFAFEAIVAAVFFGICIYAGLVFQRLRSERREAQRLRDVLEQQALTDTLTALPNRRDFERILESELDRMRRYGGFCTVAMIDVDYFKNYNDTLGHPAGDTLLKELAHVLRLQMRQSDFVARYGGEEFALVMVNTPGSDGADVMERLRRHIETYRFSDEHVQPEGRITISSGLACFPENGTTYEELISHADEALYVAKSRGRNRVCGP